MKNSYIYFFVSAFFLFIIATAIPLFSDGMFMDGLLYATISNNMANGLGSFWNPYLSDSVFPQFYEHPPLALGLQSVCFRLFGDSIYTERLFSLFTCLISSIGLVLIWKQLGQSIKTGWIPLFFWLAVSNVSWGYANNMLENTMTVFNTNETLFNIIKINTITIVTTGISLSIMQVNVIGRDKEEINDAYKVIQKIGIGKKINICPSQYGNWSKHGYYARYGEITLVRNKNEICEYYLANKNDCVPKSTNYKLVPLDLETQLV